MIDELKRESEFKSSPGYDGHSNLCERGCERLSIRELLLIHIATSKFSFIVDNLRPTLQKSGLRFSFGLVVLPCTCMAALCEISAWIF